MKMDLGYTRLIIEECRKAGLLRNQCAYVLARRAAEVCRFFSFPPLTI